MRDVVEHRVGDRERVSRCLVCGSESVRTWRRRCRDRLYGAVAGEFDYARCRRCGLVFMATRVVERDAHLLYPQDEYAPYQAPGAATVNASVAGPLARVLSNGVARRANDRARHALERVAPDRLPQELGAVEVPGRPDAA